MSATGVDAPAGRGRCDRFCRGLGNSQLPRLLSPLLLAGIWQLVYTLLQPALLPSPGEVLSVFWTQIAAGELPMHFLVTLQRISLAFALAMVGGAIIGLLMGHFTLLDKWLDVPLMLLLNIPALVIIVLCLIWIGLNENAVICAVVANKLPNMAVIFREGGKAIDHRLLQVAGVFQLPFGRMLGKVYLPQLLPFFLTAARSGLALVWKIVLVVELIGCSSGVGFQIGVYFQLFDIASILAYTLAFMLVMVAIETLLLRPAEHYLNRWKSC